MRKQALTARQKRFCEEYLKDLNATRAAKDAGYSPKTANREGPRLLSNAGIQAIIQELLNKRSERTQITTDDVLRELSSLAFPNRGAGDVADRDRLRALELLGKHLAMFTDKHQVDGNLGVALKIVKHYDGERPDSDNSADETHEDGL